MNVAAASLKTSTHPGISVAALALGVGGLISGTLGFGSASLQAGTAGSGLDGIIELRGYAKIGDEYEFSIYNTHTERGEWLREDESREGYEIKAFDPENNTVTIRYNDQIGTISLQRSRIVAYDPSATPSMPAREPPTPAPSGPPASPSEGGGGGGGSAPQQAGENTPRASRDDAAPPGTPGIISGGSGEAEQPDALPPSGGGSGGVTEDDDNDSPSELSDSPPPDPDSAPPGYTPEQ